MTNNRSVFLVLLCAMFFLAVNMRSPIVAFGSLASKIQADLGLTASLVGLVGAVPMMAFAIGSLIAPKISRQIGLERAVLSLSVVLTLAIFLRVQDVVLFGTPWLLFFFGTVVLSFAIALGNVLIPAIIKKHAKEKLAFTTGIYSMCLSLFAGLSAGVVTPLSVFFAKDGENWRAALGIWATAGVIASVLWLFLYRHWQKNPAISHTPSTHRPKTKVWRSPLAWWLSAMMGLQSVLYYSLASFLVLFLMSRDVPAARAGQVMMLMQFMAIPSALFLARYVARGHSIRLLAMTAGLMNVAGVAGFAFLSTGFMWLCATLVGAGCALIFTLSLMLFGLKTDNDADTAALSGMVQAVGYGIAFFGPWLLGLLLAWSGGFMLPWSALIAVMCVNLVASWFATADKKL